MESAKHLEIIIAKARAYDILVAKSKELNRMIEGSDKPYPPIPRLNADVGPSEEMVLVGSIAPYGVKTTTRLITGPNVPRSEFIKSRQRMIAGLTVEKALKQRIQDKSGERIYNKNDIVYDIQKGYLKIADPTSGRKLRLKLKCLQIKNGETFEEMEVRDDATIGQLVGIIESTVSWSERLWQGSKPFHFHRLQSNGLRALIHKGRVIYRSLLDESDMESSTGSSLFSCHSRKLSDTGISSGAILAVVLF